MRAISLVAMRKIPAQLLQSRIEDYLDHILPIISSNAHYFHPDSMISLTGASAGSYNRQRTRLSVVGNRYVISNDYDIVARM